MRSKRDSSAAGSAMFSAGRAAGVVAAVRRVGGRQQRGARVERRGDARLGDAHRLLLHHLRA